MKFTETAQTRNKALSQIIPQVSTDNDMTTDLIESIEFVKVSEAYIPEDGSWYEQDYTFEIKTVDE